MDYKLKYEKYKYKYLMLKNTQSGGSNIPKLYLYKASWCGHCQNFEPTWKQLIENPEYKGKINFITMDSELNKKEIKEKNIEGFPTIILEKNNKEIEYNGSREKDDLHTFIQEHI